MINMNELQGIKTLFEGLFLEIELDSLDMVVDFTVCIRLLSGATEKWSPHGYGIITFGTRDVLKIPKSFKVTLANWF